MPQIFSELWQKVVAFWQLCPTITIFSKSSVFLTRCLKFRNALFFAPKILPYPQKLWRDRLTSRRPLIRDGREGSEGDMAPRSVQTEEGRNWVRPLPSNFDAKRRKGHFCGAEGAAEKFLGNLGIFLPPTFSTMSVPAVDGATPSSMYVPEKPPPLIWLLCAILKILLNGCPTQRSPRICALACMSPG